MMKKKGYKAGGGPLPMKKGPDGKMVPEFAMDGEGVNDLKKDKPKKFQAGKMVNGMKKKGYAKGGMKKATKRAVRFAVQVLLVKVFVQRRLSDATLL